MLGRSGESKGNVKYITYDFSVVLERSGQVFPECAKIAGTLDDIAIVSIEVVNKSTLLQE